MASLQLHRPRFRKPGTNAHMDGKKTRKLTASTFSSPQCLRIGSRRCSTALGRRSPTQRPPGCLRATMRRPPTSKSHQVSRIPQYSPSWASRANSTTNHTMNIQSQYIPALTYSSKRNRIHRRTIFQKYHPPTQKAQKERAV